MTTSIHGAEPASHYFAPTTTTTRQSEVRDDLEVRASSRPHPLSRSSADAESSAESAPARQGAAPVIGEARLQTLSARRDYYASLAGHFDAMQASGAALSEGSPAQLAKLQEAIRGMDAEIALYRRGETGEGFTEMRHAVALAGHAEHARTALGNLVRGNVAQLLPQVGDFRHRQLIADTVLDHFDQTLRRLRDRLDPAVTAKLDEQAKTSRRDVGRAIDEAQISHDMLALIGEAGSEFGSARAEGLSWHPGRMLGSAIGSTASHWLGLELRSPSQQVSEELEAHLGDMFEIRHDADTVHLSLKPALHGRLSVADTLDRLNTLLADLQRAGHDYARLAVEAALENHPDFRLLSAGETRQVSLTPAALQKLERREVGEVAAPPPTAMERLETRMILNSLRPAVKQYVASSRWEDVATLARALDTNVEHAAGLLTAFIGQTGASAYGALPEMAKQALDALSDVPGRALVGGAELIGRGGGTVGGWLVGSPFGSIGADLAGGAGASLGGALGRQIGQWLVGQAGQGARLLSEAPSMLHSAAVDRLSEAYRGLQEHYDGPEQFAATLERSREVFGDLFLIEGDPASKSVTVRNNPAWNNRHPDELVAHLNQRLAAASEAGDKAATAAIRQGLADHRKVDIASGDDGATTIRRRADADNPSLRPASSTSPQDRLSRAVLDADAARRLSFIKLSVGREMRAMIQEERGSASALFNFHRGLTQAKADLLEQTLDALIDCTDRDSMVAELDSAIAANHQVSREIWKRPDGGKTETFLRSLRDQVAKFDPAKMN